MDEIVTQEGVYRGIWGHPILGRFMSKKDAVIYKKQLDVEVIKNQRIGNIKFYVKDLRTTRRA
jgi:hypothetical protein